MEAYFGKWKLNHEECEGVEEFMDAEEMPEMFKEKMKEVDVFFSLEEVADEPGKYDWKVDFGDIFTMDEFYELGVEHKLTRPMQGEEVTSVFTMSPDGILMNKVTRDNGDETVSTTTIVDDGAAMEVVRKLIKADGTEVEAKQKFIKVE